VEHARENTFFFSVPKTKVSNSWREREREREGSRNPKKKRGEERRTHNSELADALGEVNALS
jgi:hypothetical protein